MKTSVKKIIITVILVPVLIVSIYFFAVLVGAMPTVVAPTDTDRAEYQIFFTNNKYHVEICLPAKFSPFREDIEKVRGDSGPDEGYYCIGWGDRTFYPETPFLEDLHFLLVVHSLFWPTDAAIRISFYKGPIQGKVVTSYKTDKQTIELLYEFIENHLIWEDDGNLSVIPPETVNAVYGDSLFLNAKGTYSLLFTCNNWTADALKYAGIKTGLWTPFAGNVLRNSQADPISDAVL